MNSDKVKKHIDLINSFFKKKVSLLKKKQSNLLVEVQKEIDKKQEEHSRKNIANL